MLLGARYGRVDVEAIKASAREHDGELTFSAKVIDWCEDSLELLDLLCELVPDKKLLIRRKGLKFFAEINYNFVKAVRSRWQRIHLYFMVFRKFNYAYSPIAFFIKKSFLFRKLHSVARRAKRLAGRSNFAERAEGLFPRNR